MSGHVVIVGMMGVGKSTVGSLLAERLGHPFVDLDAAVESAAGMEVAEIFESRGEAAFRRLESDALGTALSSPTPSVVATGGGVLLDPANRTIVAGHRVVWLRAAPEVLAERVASAGGRPLLDDLAEGESAADRLRSIADARRSSYQETADIVVDVDEMSPGEVVDALASELSSGGSADVGEDRT